MTKLACSYIYTVHLYMCSYMYIWKKRVCRASQANGRQLYVHVCETVKYQGDST